MVTAGDSFLHQTLNTSGNAPLTMANANTPASARPAPPPNMPASERSAEAEAEIDKEARRARENEVKRVQDGPPAWWNLGPAGSDKGGTGAQGPGGYKFDPQTIAAKITQWEQVRDDIAKDGSDLRQASQVLKPPSPDQPAVEQTKAATVSIIAAMRHNSKMQDYAQAYIDSLRKANGTYVEHEKNVSDAFHDDTGDLYK